jgi:hypothetical protein
MKLHVPNGPFIKINHPALPIPVATPPMPQPKLILEKKKKT